MSRQDKSSQNVSLGAQRKHDTSPRGLTTGPICIATALLLSLSSPTHAITPAAGVLYGAGAGAVTSVVTDQSLLQSVGIGALLGYLIQQVYTPTTLPQYFADTGVHIIDDQQGAHLVIGTDLLFTRPNGLVIDGRYYPVLNKIVELLEQHPEVQVGVSGFTDSTLPKARQYEFSMAEAQAVADYLLSRGVDGRRIRKVSGMANSDPVFDDGAVNGRRANRRVEVSLLLNQPQLRPQIYAVDPAYSPVYGTPMPVYPLPTTRPAPLG